MTFNGWLQIALFCGVIILLVKPLGGYMTRVFAGERTFLSPVLGPLERGLYRLAGIDEKAEQSWVGYTVAMLVFSLVGFLSLYALQRLQMVLPFNPAGQSAVEQSLAFNTAMSFDTNTNWQSYVPESTMSYLVQMAGLTVHNFLSAAIGIALAVALVRGFARRSATGIGNFWADMVRCTLYILLPISIVGCLFFVWQGMPQNLGAYTEATTLEGAKQVIAQGPVASQEVIKMLGTNGGGFFNANSAHPFENPNAITNLVQMVLLLSIGAALTNVFGRMVGDQRQGWAVFTIMGLLCLAGVTILYWAEAAGNPALAHLGIAGGNMEGKEVRFGLANSALFATVTTDASCGAVNTMHDSLTPLGGLVPLFNIQLGEIIFGGVGSGLYGMLLFAIISVFVAGLMVGRTPEYLGKKIEAKEVKMAMLAVLILPLSILGFSAIASVVDAGLAGPANQGPHGFSEILYAYTSATGNNGSAFAGISANTPFYNTTIGFAMFIGRFLMIVPAMAIAGSLAAKKIVPASAGTFPTHGPVFVGLVVGVILIVGGLTFFPALALGPLVEHVAMKSGTLF
jgi:K+-transporting ATPase ATPase A chain